MPHKNCYQTKSKLTRQSVDVDSNGTSIIN